MYTNTHMRTRAPTLTHPHTHTQNEKNNLFFKEETFSNVQRGDCIAYVQSLGQTIGGSGWQVQG